MTPSTRSRGYLPHLEAQQAIYFVTFRLADSLPKELVLQLGKQREALKKASRAPQLLVTLTAFPNSGLCCRRPNAASTAG